MLFSRVKMFSLKRSPGISLVLYKNHSSASLNGLSSPEVIVEDCILRKLYLYSG